VWELLKESVPVTLITDSMVGHVMHTQDVACVIVGADRVAANGDVANKIGTYGIAVLARTHGIPFYVAAPTSTIDLSIRSGQGITIEQRSDDEVTAVSGHPVAARGSHVLNPSFDVTPHHYVTAIITERGIISVPYSTGLREAASGSSGRRD
jgi:methylthioribose-1-phosphate isomerase